MNLFRTWWMACVVLFTLFTACNKDQSTEGGGKPQAGAYYLRCSIDGTAKTFNINAACSKQDLGGGTMSYSIFGKAVNDPSNFESFGFSLQAGTDLTAGTYSEIDSSATYYLAGVYNPNTTEATEIFASIMDPNDPFVLTVTEVTDSIMTGTFKGKLFLNTMDSVPSSIVVTKGEFKVRVQ